MTPTQRKRLARNPAALSLAFVSYADWIHTRPRAYPSSFGLGASAGASTLQPPPVPGYSYPPGPSSTFCLTSRSSKPSTYVFMISDARSTCGRCLAYCPAGPQLSELHRGCFAWLRRRCRTFLIQRAPSQQGPCRAKCGSPWPGCSSPRSREDGVYIRGCDIADLALTIDVLGRVPDRVGPGRACITLRSTPRSWIRVQTFPLLPSKLNFNADLFTSTWRFFSAVSP